jgi:hypothetical protein
LLEHTAPKALYNSDARYDAPKCDEDTRVEVTGEIMTFIEDWDGPERLLCMTGAAGSGKSALQQTIAEICGGKKTLGSSFFFSAADSSRNTVEPVIPTIAYQLGRDIPEVRKLIKGAVEKDRLIFSQSLKDQTTTLIVKPFEHLAREGLDLVDLPYAILIDGLDECSNEDCQAKLLAAITECLLADHLPFRIFIASRPEWAIRTALQPGGYLHTLAYHIQLSDNYDASGDMRRYLTRRFDALSSRTGNPRWFTERDVDTLVDAASGQFIYVATAFKYISERRGSPAVRLKIVLTWTSQQGGKARPFEALDTLYSGILSTARDAYEAVDTNGDRDFLLLLRTYHINITTRSSSSWDDSTLPYAFPDETLTKLLGLEDSAEDTIFADLRSLLVLERSDLGHLGLHLYHKSFSDFLQEESRSKDLYVPRSRICAHLVTCSMQTIIEYPLDLDSGVETALDSGEDAVPCLPRWLEDTTDALPRLLEDAWAADAVSVDNDLADFARKGGWRKLDGYLVLLRPRWGWDQRFGYFREWIQHLQKFIRHLTVSDLAPLRAAN